LAFAGTGRTAELVPKEDDLQHGHASEGDGDQEEHREDEQHMGQDRVQEDPGVDGRQAEADARGFRAAGGERPHVHQVRPRLRRGRGLRPDGVHRADNAHHPGSCISNQSPVLAIFYEPGRKYPTLDSTKLSSRLDSRYRNASLCVLWTSTSCPFIILRECPIPGNKLTSIIVILLSGTILELFLRILSNLYHNCVRTLSWFYIF